MLSGYLGISEIFLSRFSGYLSRFQKVQSVEILRRTIAFNLVGTGGVFYMLSGYLGISEIFLRFEPFENRNRYTENRLRNISEYLGTLKACRKPPVPTKLKAMVLLSI